MYIHEVKIQPPFCDLFPIDDKLVEIIAEDIRRNQYNNASPVVVWKDKDILIDGHTRVKAAILAERDIVPHVSKPFRNEEEALAYTIHHQRNRRNMTDKNLLRCIEAVDKRRERGGDRRSEEAKSKPPNGGIEKSKSLSAQETAQIVGISYRKVERARAVLADPKEKEAVLAGKKTIHKAAQDAKAKKKKPVTQNRPNQESGRKSPSETKGGKNRATPKPPPAYPEHRKAVDLATFALSQLDRIRDEDPAWDEAMRMVAEWLSAKLKGRKSSVKKGA